MNYAAKQRRISAVISIIAAVLFLGISVFTIIWAGGLKFDKQTGTFKKTAVIAVNNSLADVTVTLNGDIVGNATPITLDQLPSGRYTLLLTKPGFYPYERIFSLQAGEAAVIKAAVLVAEKPLSETTTAAYVPIDPFDVGLVFQDGELWSFGNLVSRFSALLTQVHRLNTSYVYQQEQELHLFFPESNQDYVVYTAPSPGLIKFNLIPADWALTIFSDSQPTQKISLTTPSAVSE